MTIASLSGDAAAWWSGDASSAIAEPSVVPACSSCYAVTELGAALNAALVALGAELGLYKAMADAQLVTAAELATRTQTHERYVREWLNVQAASGFVVYDAGLDAYVLPPEHALVLADDASPVSLTADFEAANAVVAIRERLAERFVSGDGVGWHEHHHGLWHGTERSFGITTARTSWPSGCRRSTGSWTG